MKLKLQILPKFYFYFIVFLLTGIVQQPTSLWLGASLWRFHLLPVLHIQPDDQLSCEHDIEVAMIAKN